METESVNLLQQEVQLPCSRLVNGFRLCPFFSLKKKLFWVIKPNRSDYYFVFSSLKSAEKFANSYCNNHTSKYWFKLFRPLYQPIRVCSSYDGFEESFALLNSSYCNFILDAIYDSVHCK